MAIDYMADIHGLHYAGKVVSDPEYSAIPADLRDDDSEQRILTTIEVLRSHLAIIESRTEANLLLEAIARLTARVGSGGFIYDPETITATGNVPAPTFSPGDGLSVTTSAGTVVATSPSGGAPSVVVSELNAALTGSAAEVATFTATDDVDGSLGEKYFTINGPTGAPTDDYYVWFRHAGQAAWEEITMVAANTLALSTTPGGPAAEGSYWLIDTVGANYFVWYDVQAQAEVTDIVLDTGTSYPVETTWGVPPTTAGAYWDLDDLDTIPNALRYWYNVEDPLFQDVTMPVGGSGALLPAGGAPASYFTLEVPLGHPAFPGFYVWFNLLYAGGNADPGAVGPAVPLLAGYTGLMIEIAVLTPQAGLVTEVLINSQAVTAPGAQGITLDPLAAGEFAGSVPAGPPGVITIVNATPGANVLATDGPPTQDVWFTDPAPAPILTPGPPPPVGPNAMPPTGGRTLVMVGPFSQSALSPAIAAATDAAIIGSPADVGTVQVGGLVTITQNTAGAVAPIADTGGALFLPPAITTPGIDNNVIPTGGSTVGRTGIEVDVLWTDLAGGVGPNNVASKTGVAINNVDVVGGQFGTSTEVRLQHQAVGDIAPGAQDFNAGVAPLPPLAVGVDPATTDPTPGPTNMVVVDITVGELQNNVATLAENAITAQAAVHFTTGGGAANEIRVTNTVGGNAPNATAGDSGFALAITDGTAGTPASVEAYLTNGGKSIGFRNTAANPDTPFTLALGPGGILEATGIRAGEYTTTKITVAAQGRDRALAVYEGQARDPAL